ncbi:DNA/RNA polymerases superfamily protein [Gossypium australe]|uniref:DNA/RNA polymerases superfamily protein n=1 Tax=Gossypium australe TaxID=47621 RepID=A0A5B6W5E0_9ROSI|nr:DNA/RNA polymerases superfamily protein [Gossypium australe]
MLWCCIIEFEGSWEKYFPLVEFAYNNNYQASIKMASYEALNGRKCRSPLFWSELSGKKLTEVDLVRETKEKYLKVSPWKRVLRFGRKGRLGPRFIGLYENLTKFTMFIMFQCFDDIDLIRCIFCLRRKLNYSLI